VGASVYPCLQCGRLTESHDHYVVCDVCLGDLESRLSPSGEIVDIGPAPLAVASFPLSEDERIERLRRLLDDW
jgi:hypothetical protein